MKIYIVFSFLITSCSTVKNICAKDLMNNGKFSYLQNGIPDNSYFTFQGNTHEEYQNGKLYSSSRLEWNSCNEYKIIIQKANYPDDGTLFIGDTLHVKITSVVKDTFTCAATALGFTAEFKFVRVWEVKNRKPGK